jgi:hypothetical protein
MYKLLNEVGVTGAGASFGTQGEGPEVFQVTLAGSGTPTATVAVEVSMDESNWINYTTTVFTDAGTTGFPCYARYPYYRGNVSAISSASNKVTVLMKN